MDCLSEMCAGPYCVLSTQNFKLLRKTEIFMKVLTCEHYMYMYMYMVHAVRL